jgi:predicted P-loop ATPase
MSTDNKDFFMQFEGKAIIEFSEGETLSRTEVKKMKSIITTAVDRYRPSYGRVSEDFPRRCVFAMTTNQDEYLKDETGNRRWLPVRVVLPEANVQWLADNRDQLLAEAYTRVITNHETTYEFPREETLAQQSARRISDPNEDRVIEWYYNDPHLTDTMRDEGITVQQVYTFALSGLGQMRRYDEQNIAGILREKLKLTRVRRSIGGTQQWRWINENVSLFTALEEDLAKDVWNEK